jgi:Mce-associated membrane protein
VTEQTRKDGDQAAANADSRIDGPTEAVIASIESTVRRTSRRAAECPDDTEEIDDETRPDRADLGDATEPDGRTDLAATADDEPVDTRRTIAWSRIAAFGLLPALALLMAVVAGGLKWQDSSICDADTARAESVQSARDSAVALLSYRPETVDRQLIAAGDRLTGQFRDSYLSLVKDVVIPGAKQKQIATVATVPAAATISATSNHAVVLIFVDQSVSVGTDAPTQSASTVQVTMDKMGDRWLISAFDPR